MPESKHLTEILVKVDGETHNLQDVIHVNTDPQCLFQLLLTGGLTVEELKTILELEVNEQMFAPHMCAVKRIK